MEYTNIFNHWHAICISVVGLLVSSTDSVGLKKRMKVLINGHTVDSVVASQVSNLHPHKPKLLTWGKLLCFKGSQSSLSAKVLVFEQM